MNPRAVVRRHKTTLQPREKPLKTVHASLTPQAIELLDELVSYGVYGRTRADAIRRIVDRFLVEETGPRRAEAARQ